MTTNAAASPATGVLLVFADSSLGGTSRSALQFARAWRAAGREVHMLALEPVAAGRQVDDAVQTLDSLDAVPWDEIGVVHLHHWNWAQDERDRVGRLIETVQALPRPPRLLTNNIFATPDPLLRAWPAPAAVGVLGTWAAHQYLTATAGRPHPEPFVIGNPQDTTFFRPPTADERAEARAALGVDGPVVLRAGSPLDNKWSPVYGPLAAATENEGVTLVLVSPPDSVREAVSGRRGVQVLDRIRDDELMRRWYWAADSFALDAARGESFGNVIMEALATGLPVVYRGRPLRDNTPWEFRDVPGFTYVEDDDAWVHACIDAAHEPRPVEGDDDVRGTRDLVEQRYGVAGIGALLDAAATALAVAPAESRLVSAPLGGRRAELSARQRLDVAVRHNPLAAVVKTSVNRLRASGAGSPVAIVRGLRGR